MRRMVTVIAAALLLTGGPAVVSAIKVAGAPPAQAAAPAKGAKPAASAESLDRLFAPIALYPDQLLAQMLLCAANPGKVATLNEWLASHQTEKGTALQDAAAKAGFDASFVALALFPDVVSTMAGQIDWTRQLGEAFAADRTAVFASIQRLRSQAQKAGTLKNTPQQDVETKTTSSGRAGDRHRAGEPAGRLRAAIQPAGRLRATRRRRPSSCRRAAARMRSRPG